MRLVFEGSFISPGRALAWAGFAWFLASAAACGSTDETCGAVIWRTCKLVAATDCAATTGCSLSVPHCGPSCENAVVPNSCEAAGCLWEPSNCRSACSLADGAEACAALSQCSWSGQSCVDSCALRATEHDCSAPGHDGATACTWFPCGGETKACSAYSLQDCPTLLGCEHVKHPVISAQ
jgi:hypothetical protein